MKFKPSVIRRLRAASPGLIVFRSDPKPGSDTVSRGCSKRPERANIAASSALGEARTGPISSPLSFGFGFFLKTTQGSSAKHRVSKTPILDTFKTRFSLKPEKKGTVQTPQHHPDGLLCPPKLSAGLSGSARHVSTSLPALAGARCCCATAAALTALRRGKLQSVFTFTREKSVFTLTRENRPQRKR